MPNELHVRVRQKTRTLRRPLLLKILRHILADLLQAQNYTVCFHFIQAREMTALNEKFLGHPGSTDVITFASDPPTNPSPATSQPSLHGEIFISIDDAISQARVYRASWPSELVRYAIHGLLHLRGFDDLEPRARSKMKREENRLLRLVQKKFPLSDLDASCQ